MKGYLSPAGRIVQGIIIGLAGTVISIAFWLPGWFSRWEEKTWDWRVSVLAKPGLATEDILLILLDQNSLDWAKEENGLTWPWPREVYGAIIDYCKRCGAKAVAFDVLFTEPSKYGVVDDATFGKAVSGYGRMAGAVFLGDKAGSTTAWPDNLLRSNIDISGLGDWLTFTGAEGIVFKRAVMPVPEVAESAAFLCNVHLNPDPDGIYRRVNHFGVFDNIVLPSLGLGVYLAANPEAALQIKQGCLTVDNIAVPIDVKGSTVLRFRGPSGTHTAYSAASVLQSEIRMRMGGVPTKKNDLFRDKYVLFGFSAPGLFDLRPVPVGGAYPGIEISATMLDNLLSGDFMRVVPDWVTVSAVLVLTFLCAFTATFFSSPVASVLISFMFLTAPVLLSLFLYSGGYWLQMIVLEAAAAITLAITVGVNYATEGRQKRYINSAFKHYLSPAVIEQLIQHPEQLVLGGERKILSIFFSDLQGFTSISEELSPEDLTALLNEYLSAMTDIVLEEGGTVDKYEGDAIIAFWNAPLEVSGHPARAVCAALRCQAKLAQMRPVFRKRIDVDMFMRIGLNTGPAVVGNMGSHSRFDYTMLGDSVNLAARLEGANKQFGTYTMVSQSTMKMSGDKFVNRELARLAVVGRKDPVIVYEPMFREDYEIRREVLENFNSGLNMFYDGRFEQAMAIFSKTSDQDSAAAAYKSKCAGLIGTRPQNWKGVWVMTTK